MEKRTPERYYRLRNFNNTRDALDCYVVFDKRNVDLKIMDWEKLKLLDHKQWHSNMLMIDAEKVLELRKKYKIRKFRIWVTGRRHLIEHARSIFLDMGLYVHKRKIVRDRVKEIPYILYRCDQ